MENNQSQQPNLSTLLRLWGGNSRSVAYRPELAKQIGSVTATILLSQIYFWWQNKGFQPFFKFKEPCEKHKLYEIGDSWCEELAFGRSEFSGALKVIGTKVKSAHSKEAAMKFNLPKSEDFLDYPDQFEAAFKVSIAHLVIYWTDQNNLTWYEINARLLNDVLECAFQSEYENRIPIGKYENRIPLTENTTDINTYLSQDAKAPAIIAEVAPKPESPKPRKRNPLIDAVGLASFKTTNLASLGPRVGNIVYGNKKMQCDGLLAFEAERQGKSRQELDIEALAKDVPLFWRWYCDAHPNMELRDCVKWVERWAEWRTHTDKVNGTGTAGRPQLPFGMGQLQESRNRMINYIDNELWIYPFGENKWRKALPNEQ